MRVGHPSLPVSAPPAQRRGRPTFRVSSRLPLHLLALVMMAAAVTAQEVPAVHEVKVGPQSIRIPAPAGFERMDGIDARQDEVAAEFAGATNRRLIMFGTPAAVAALRRGEAPLSPRNFNAQTLRSLEHRALTSVQFESLRAQAESELGTLGKRMDAVLGRTMDNAAKSLSEKLQESVEVKVGTPVPLGTFERTRDSLGFSMLIKSELSIAGKETAGLSVVACMIVRVRDRCLYLYATSDRRSAEDEKWVKEEVLRWRDAIFAANGQADAPASSSVSRFLQHFDLQAILRTAAIGAIAGAVIGLIAFLRRRKKANPPSA